MPRDCFPTSHRPVIVIVQFTLVVLPWYLKVFSVQPSIVEIIQSIINLKRTLMAQWFSVLGEEVPDDSVV